MPIRQKEGNMNLATSTNPNWESRSVDTYIEWHGVQVNVIGTEWRLGAQKSLDIETVLAVKDVKNCTTVVDITELVAGLDGFAALEERLGYQTPPKKAAPVCYRLACPDRTFLQLDPYSAPQCQGPLAVTS